MVDNTGNTPARERLPIKLIMPKQGTERRISGGGSPPKPFRDVDQEYRQRLSNQVAAIQDAIAPQLKQTKVAPVRVKVIAKAAAKSHRPKRLFSDQSCPIIGGGRIGELFIKATSRGLAELAKMIEQNTSEHIVKELSCIESIEVVTPALRRGGRNADEILRHSPRRRDGFITRVRLFDFGADDDHPALVANFKAICAERHIRLDQRGYAARSWTFAAECRTVNDIDALSRVIGVRSISHMPLVRTIRPRTLSQQALPALPTRDQADKDVPVVVVVDSGITSTLPALNSWVVGRDSQVAPMYENTDHGTFVAGLICFGHELNPTIAGMDGGPCAVFDLQVIPNDDPERGETLALMESELLISLESALREHANDYRVWNLSLGTDVVCSLDEFSELAEELDNLQEQYNVSFVISAGNYETAPLLDYPRSAAQIEPGRITSPADSVLGITVGSVSHIDYKKNGPKQHHPSAFSRHGAGPNYIIKPDLVHYGGSCSVDGMSVHGVRSLTEAGLAEDLGTSVGADSNLSHRADPILSQGWKPTLRSSAVDKCRSLPGSLISSVLC